MNRLRLRCFAVLRVQQIVKPLDHDSRWKIRQRDKFVRNHVTISIQAGELGVRVCRAGLIGSSQQAFVGTDRVSHPARFHDSNSKCSARLIVTSRHNYGLQLGDRVDWPRRRSAFPESFLQALERAGIRRRFRLQQEFPPTSPAAACQRPDNAKPKNNRHKAVAQAE